MWAWPGCAPLTVLTAHENKVMGCDISRDGRFILSCGFDRTFKLWTAPLD
jgi:U4/U6 small nuclear ribonucleoprotein PRP4